MPSEGSTPPRQAFLTRPLPVLLLLALLATTIYSNTFSAPFHFDDTPNIVENPRIKDLSNFTDLSGTRSVGFLSFALNYHFGGLNVFGYHLANLIIHIINGFLVYQLVLLIGGPSAVALSTSLLFIVHPIQTQAVTYIVQRFASLATLFYLLAVVCYLKWRSAPTGRASRSRWYVAALLSTVLAMKTKEIAFTLPLMILLIEIVFFRPFSKERWRTLLPFLLALLIIPLSRSDVVDDPELGLTQQTDEISRSDYLFTQFRVIHTYLRLLILPVNQNLIHDIPIDHSLFEPVVFLSSLFLLLLLALGASLLRRLPIVAFGIFWFFLTLAIESSVVPIEDVIFEHRVYLPSIGAILAATTAVERLFAGIATASYSRAIVLLFLGVTATLGAMTYQRNMIWKDPVTLWSDVVEKSPGKARGHNMLSNAYLAAGEIKEAIREMEAAIQIKPHQAEFHNNLGVIYTKSGEGQTALLEYQEAVRLKPDYADAHNNLGTAYAIQGEIEKAILEFQESLKLKPDAKVHFNLGTAYGRNGQLDNARTQFEQALALKPKFDAARQALQSLAQ